MKFNYPVPSHFQFSGRDGSGTWKKVRDGSGTRIPSDPDHDMGKFFSVLLNQIKSGMIEDIRYRLVCQIFVISFGRPSLLRKVLFLELAVLVPTLYSRALEAFQAFKTPAGKVPRHSRHFWEAVINSTAMRRRGQLFKRGDCFQVVHDVRVWKGCLGIWSDTVRLYLRREKMHFKFDD